MSLVLEIGTSNEWHVLKGENKFGPFTYTDMIQMMQNKTLFNFDYVWSPHLESWTALAEVPEFSPDRLLRIKEKSPQSEAFNRRATTRVTVDLKVYCHDNSRFWSGVCENLSEGGGLIMMENPLLLPGHLINVHFRTAKANEMAFNCVVEVIAKRLTKQRIQHDTGLHYAVKFMEITPAGQQQVKLWVNEKIENLKLEQEKN